MKRWIAVILACNLWCLVRCSGGVKAWALGSSNPDVPLPDLVVRDSCGQAAFDEAGSKVCHDPSFENMMPIGLLWLNCKQAAAGIEQVRCGWTPSNKLVTSLSEMRKCSGALSTDVYFRLIHFTMLAFEACETIAGEVSAVRVRLVVSKLVEEAKKSAEAQGQVREFMEEILVASKNLLEIQDQLAVMASSIQASGSEATIASRRLAQGLVAAAEQTSQFSVRMTEFGKNVEEDVGIAEEAIATMNTHIETAFSQFEEAIKSHEKFARWNRLCVPLAVAVSALMLLSSGVHRQECCVDFHVIFIRCVSIMMILFVFHSCDETLLVQEVPETPNRGDSGWVGDLLRFLGAVGILWNVYAAAQTYYCRQNKMCTGAHTAVQEDARSETSFSTPAE